MLLEVAVQVGLLAEATVAQVALEGLFLVVNVADVSLQVGRDAEGAVAVFTPAGHKADSVFFCPTQAIMKPQKREVENSKMHELLHNESGERVGFVLWET